ncbi:MAG: hypothetical protein WD063_15070 [Pirellulales bacterium]
MTPRIHAAFAVVASIVVAFAVAWGFVLVGSPATRRLERFDEQRLADLRTIAREIQGMVEDPNEKGTLKGALPKTLAEAAAKARNERVHLRDPETGEPYAYTVTNETTIELCATFARPRDSDWDVFWNHSAGRHCFTINVLDPPPY